MERAPVEQTRDKKPWPHANAVPDAATASYY